MKIMILCVGKKRIPSLQTAIDDYTKRTSHSLRIEWQVVPAAKTEAKAKVEETEAILKRLDTDDCVVLLDERGQQYDNIAFATWFETQLHGSHKRLVFVIGGAHGVNQELFERAQLVWSFSPLVFPHEVMRLILSEQLYRTVSILQNRQYHHI